MGVSAKDQGGLIGEYQRSFTMPENWASCYLRLNGATMTDLRD